MSWRSVPRAMDRWGQQHRQQPRHTRETHHSRPARLNTCVSILVFFSEIKSNFVQRWTISWVTADSRINVSISEQTSNVQPCHILQHHEILSTVRRTGAISVNLHRRITAIYHEMDEISDI